MKLYEEPIRLREATGSIEWESRPKRKTVQGILLWMTHCTGILNSTKALPLRNDERIDLEDILCVIQDLDARVFSSLQAKLHALNGESTGITRSQWLEQLQQARNQLHQAFKKAPLSINLNSAPSKGIPNVSSLELRIRLLCKQTSSQNLRHAIKQLHRDYLQIHPGDGLRKNPKYGIPSLIFLGELDLPQQDTLYFLGCTAEVCPVGMGKLQDVYRKRHADRFTEEEKSWIENACQRVDTEVRSGVANRPRSDTEHSARISTLDRLTQEAEMLRHSYASCRTRGSGLKTKDMEDRDRCHMCRVRCRFEMPYETALSESKERDIFYHPLSCAESLVMALQNRYLSEA